MATITVKLEDIPWTQLDKFYEMVGIDDVHRFYATTIPEDESWELTIEQARELGVI